MGAFLLQAAQGCWPVRAKPGCSRAPQGVERVGGGVLAGYSSPALGPAAAAQQQMLTMDQGEKLVGKKLAAFATACPLLTRPSGQNSLDKLLRAGLAARPLRSRR